MASTHTYAAVLAIFVVLAFAGANLTGNASAHRIYQHGDVNFYINSVDLPTKFTPGMPTYNSKATITNAGSQSASFVHYTLELYDPGGRYSAVAGFVHIGAGETKTFDLPSMPDLTVGTYRATFKIDTEDRYVETDETDNVYRTTLVLSY